MNGYATFKTTRVLIPERSLPEGVHWASFNSTAHHGSRAEVSSSALRVLQDT